MSIRLRPRKKKQSGKAQVWWLYLVRCRDGSLYTGISTNVVRRLKEHNSGKGAKYTANRLPVLLIYSEACASRSAALKREYELKSLTRAESPRLPPLRVNLR